MERSGFTLVEVAVALLLLSVGVGAVVATASTGAVLVRESGQLESQAWAAWRLIEELRAGGCPAPGSGTAGGGEPELRWAVWDVSGSAARRVQVVVRSAPGRAEAVSSLGTALPC